MPVTSLTLDEMETTTLATAVDPVVIIESTIKRHITRLRRHPAFTEVESGHWGTTEWARFSIPAELWNPATGAKRTRRPLTEEQREALAVRREKALAVRAAKRAEQAPITPGQP